MKDCEYRNGNLCEHPCKGKRFDAWTDVTHVEKCFFVDNMDFHLCKYYKVKGK